MMATSANRAGRNREARQRLEAAFVALSQRLDIAIPPEPRTMKDPALQPIVEVERFADIAETVLEALPTKESPAPKPAPEPADVPVTTTPAPARRGRS